MSNSPQQTTIHSRVIPVPAQAGYDLVAEVTRWPAIFEPCLSVRHLARAGDTERFQLWALVNGQVRSWTSRRTRDPRRLRIGFTQEHTQPPFASMAGEWTFRPVPGDRCEVVFTHRFTVADGEAPEAALAAVEHNSERELAALARLARLPYPVADVVFSFADTTHLAGPAAEAYRFVYRSDAWPQRLPHVSRVVLTEEPPGVQDMEMDTVTADGSTHTTRSIRLCFPTERIVYKQLVPPALLLGHSGEWTFTDGPDGATATARHTVAINPEAVPEILGPSRTLADAREFVRTALGANSRTTLNYASAFAQSPDRFSAEPAGFSPGRARG